MTDKPIFPQIPEVGFLSDHFVSERVHREQFVFGAYRRSDAGQIMPGVEAEGSAINNPRIKTD